MMRFRAMLRHNKRSPEGVHIWAIGLRLGYWPCLRAPFISLTFGPVTFDCWYGLPSYHATGGAA